MDEVTPWVTKPKKQEKEKNKIHIQWLFASLPQKKENRSHIDISFLLFH